MSCRFYEDVIVRNSWTPNGWEVEEREQNLNEFSIPNPIVAGDFIMNNEYTLMSRDIFFLIDSR